MPIRLGVELKGEIRGEGVIRDSQGNVKARIELRGEATQAQFDSIKQQLEEKQNGSDTLNRGS